MSGFDVCQYLVHPAFKDRLDQWLATQGMEAVRVPFLDADEEAPIPVYNIQPTPETWSKFRQGGVVR